MDRHVRARLSCQVAGPAAVELQVAAAAAGAESLTVTLDGEPLPVRELAADHGGRLHLLDTGPGRLVVVYEAVVAAQEGPVPALPLDVTRYLRPSRYAESDRLAGYAQAELGHLSDPADLLQAVAAWVGTRLAYVPGSSSGTDGAVDTLLSGAGVCRDYAHLAVALLRARDVPARLVSVYAPGLSPMDFHAVVEALVDGAWWVVDPTLLAPRATLVRIATGRDAADTAFLSSTGGRVDDVVVDVGAWTAGSLPADDLTALVALSG